MLCPRDSCRDHLHHLPRYPPGPTTPVQATAGVVSPEAHPVTWFPAQFLLLEWCLVTHRVNSKGQSPKALVSRPSLPLHLSPSMPTSLVPPALRLTFLPGQPLPPCRTGPTVGRCQLSALPSHPPSRWRPCRGWRYGLNFTGRKKC
jgi:hypothetical protein